MGGSFVRCKFVGIFGPFVLAIIGVALLSCVAIWLVPATLAGDSRWPFRTTNRWKWKMKRTSVFLLVLFTIAASFNYAAAQDQTPKPEASPATSDEERPKTEVEKAIEEAKNRGELVMAVCVVDDCGASPEAEEQLERGKALQLVKPDYPLLARRAKVQGEVRVQVLIGREGNVIAAVAISGHPLLLAASVKAARETRFTATKYQGKTVNVVGVITFNFVAQ